MSVSVTEGGSTNIDLDALVAGGDTFLARVKELQTAKAKSEKALADLNMGKDAAKMMSDAQASMAAADKANADAKTQAESIMATARIDAAALIQSANDTAAATIADAQKKASDLESQVKSGHDELDKWSNGVRAEAGTTLASAKAKLAEAERQLAANQLAAQQLAGDQAKADQALKEAQDTKTALEAKLEAIKSAAS